ncbi:MAG: helix-turn-helix domain-containing protein [Eubacteriales bacterium]|nr:helix-turn-helix domain-containing protein [Eubacteriales bacterium]
MKELNIGSILTARRRAKGVTQDEVAEYAGVSKASVSKWENGLSYPDITILPLLATYFNISIDELLGYHPQLSDKEIQKKYREFSGAFAEQPFLKVMDEVREFIRKYDSCYPLLFSMAQLYLNNFMLASSMEEGIMILDEAKALCRRIQQECEDTLLNKDALAMEAFICMYKKEPEEILSLLGGKVRAVLPTEYLIISAYQMLGENERAMEYVQASMYQQLVIMMDYLGMYLSLCSDDNKEMGMKCIRKFAEAFSMDSLMPHKLVGFFCGEAIYYGNKRDEEKTIASLEDYVLLIERNLKNFSLHGDKFFDRLDQWLEESALGYQMPRDMRLVLKDMTGAVTENPVFSFLEENPRFQILKKRLATVQEKQKDCGGGKK